MTTGCDADDMSTDDEDDDGGDDVRRQLPPVPRPGRACAAAAETTRAQPDARPRAALARRPDDPEAAATARLEAFDRDGVTADDFARCVSRLRGAGVRRVIAVRLQLGRRLGRRAAGIDVNATAVAFVTAVISVTTVTDVTAVTAVGSVASVTAGRAVTSSAAVTSTAVLSVGSGMAVTLPISHRCLCGHCRHFGQSCRCRCSLAACTAVTCTAVAAVTALLTSLLRLSSRRCCHCSHCAAVIAVTVVPGVTSVAAVASVAAVTAVVARAGRRPRAWTRRTRRSERPSRARRARRPAGCTSSPARRPSPPRNRTCASRLWRASRTRHVRRTRALCARFSPCSRWRCPCGSRRRGRRRARLEAVGCERDVMHAFCNGPGHRLSPAWPSSLPGRNLAVAVDIVLCLLLAGRAAGARVVSRRTVPRHGPRGCTVVAACLHAASLPAASLPRCLQPLWSRLSACLPAASLPAVSLPAAPLLSALRLQPAACVALFPARTRPRRRCRRRRRAAVPCRLPPVCVVVAASYLLGRSQSTGVQATVYTLLEQMPPSQEVWSACLAMLLHCGNIGSPRTLSTYIHALAQGLVHAAAARPLTSVPGVLWPCSEAANLMCSFAVGAGTPHARHVLWCSPAQRTRASTRTFQGCRRALLSHATRREAEPSDILLPAGAPASRCRFHFPADTDLVLRLAVNWVSPRRSPQTAFLRPVLRSGTTAQPFVPSTGVNFQMLSLMATLALFGAAARAQEVRRRTARGLP